MDRSDGDMDTGGLCMCVDMYLWTFCSICCEPKTALKKKNGLKKKNTKKENPQMRGLDSTATCTFWARHSWGHGAGCLDQHRHFP